MEWRRIHGNGRIEGQRARTRECKLGSVFTQTTVDSDGWPIRDPDSTTYVGAVENAAEFGYRIYPEAWRRGWEWATTKIIMGDGAVWIWNLAHRHFPGAVQIVDLYHARHHPLGCGRIAPSTRCGRSTPHAIRHVLDRARRQRHHCSALLPLQSQVRRFLGGNPRRVIANTLTSVSRTRDFLADLVR